MLRVNLSLLWANQVKEIVVRINDVTMEITNYLNYREKNEFCNNIFKELLENIKEVLNCWVGKTYIGEKKEEELKTCFQKFFEKFMELLLYFKNDLLSSNEEKNIANKCLYRGIVYRYLGHNNLSDKDKKIKPRYDEIYSSWSKLDKIEYIESKLYGWKTHISCEIKEPYYGIDLETIGISRPFEKEVVFPCIEELIKDINYFE